MDPMDVKLLNKYYAEEDEVERMILWNLIKTKGLDYVEYFEETCAYCDAVESLRNSQQINVYEVGTSIKLQNWRPGILKYRCLKCKAKKEALAAEYHRLKHQALECRREDGFILEYGKYEIYLDLLEVLKRKMRNINKTKDGEFVLSHLDHMTDMARPMTDEKIKATIVEEEIGHFLRSAKKKAFMKFTR